MAYRKLHQSEIEQLIAQGCQADDWKTINVVSDFKTENIHHIHFSGDVKLGKYDSTIELHPGIFRITGLKNAFIKDCNIQSDVYISDVKYLVNYTIEKNVIIENVDRLMVIGETSFANGVEVDALNEGGGREIPIFDRLTSQIAYLLSTYRHDLIFINNLKKIITDYVSSKKSTNGLIEQGTIITDCRVIKNVTIGSFAHISGAVELNEGTIVSHRDAPTSIGSGVIAKSFIVHTGSKINNAALLEKTFVGQGVQVGRQFSAENTLIFANSECFHSEACSIYAGPYTVTHHKSTLLIAAMFSFYNAGSGSNQSNHMYKLGPIHQGILERGAKTGSFSYLLWPSRIGAFSVVIGKHYSNFDNTNLPFSYILEFEGKTLVIPALNFFTVGTKRDSVKWPQRDRRTDPHKLDLLNFDLLSPYIIGKVLKAIDILNTLKDESEDGERFIPYQGQFIEKKRLETSIQDYRMIVDLYIGDQVIKQLHSITEKDSFKKISSSFQRDISGNTEEWTDLSGMICPSGKIKILASKINSKNIQSLEEVHDYLEEVHNAYDQLSWAWCLNLLYDRYQTDSKQLSTQTLIDIITSWKMASSELNQRILKDAGKEFASKSRIGYGIDGDASIVALDFENVVGNFEENSFVKGLRDESVKNTKIADDMISLLRSLKN